MCTSETVHHLGSLTLQLERLVDSLQHPSPPVVTTPSVNFDSPTPQVLPFKRLRSRFPETLQTVIKEVQKLTKNNLFAQRHLQEVTSDTERIRQSLVYTTAA
jgi:hypothetical protein